MSRTAWFAEERIRTKCNCAKREEDEEPYELEAWQNLKIDALIRSSRQDMIWHHLLMTKIKSKQNKHLKQTIPRSCCNLLDLRGLSGELSFHTTNDVPKLCPKSPSPAVERTVIQHISDSSLRASIHHPSSHVAISLVSAASILVSKSLCPPIRPIRSLPVALEKLRPEVLKPDAAI